MGRSGSMVRGCAPKEYHSHARGPDRVEGRPPEGPTLDARSEAGDGYFWVRITAVLMIVPVELPSRTRSV